MADSIDDIIKQYLDSDEDFGFSAVDSEELNTASSTANPEIDAIKEKLDAILELNSTCEGALQVKAQYDELLTARMGEIEKNIIPLLLNLKKNGEKDYIYWPGKQRQAQCDLQVQKLLNLTRAAL